MISNWRTWAAAASLTLLWCCGDSGASAFEAAGGGKVPVVVELPAPSREGTMTVHEALAARRSVREYSSAGLTLGQLSNLLWAAQGETADWGGRTAPSAGALYPMEMLVVVGVVSGLKTGVYRYHSSVHTLTRVLGGDQRTALSEAALGQTCINDAPVVLVLSALYRRSMKKYGERGMRYSHIETGAIAENVYLEAVSLGLGTVFVGAFRDEQVRRVLALEKGEDPLAILPVGHPVVLQQ